LRFGPLYVAYAVKGKRLPIATNLKILNGDGIRCLQKTGTCKMEFFICIWLIIQVLTDYFGALNSTENLSVGFSF
jgi:hypothetical protein